MQNESEHVILVVPKRIVGIPQIIVEIEVNAVGNRRGQGVREFHQRVVVRGEQAAVEGLRKEAHCGVR